MKKKKAKKEKPIRKRKPKDAPPPSRTEQTQSEAPEKNDEQESPERDPEEERPKPKPGPKRTGKRGIGPKEDEPEKLSDVVDRKPRQSRLPSMEDPEIEELESAAESYVSIRDQRMRLTEQEVPLKEELLSLMDKHGKTSYLHNGVDIKVVAKDRKVRVRIKKEDD